MTLTSSEREDSCQQLLEYEQYQFGDSEKGTLPLISTHSGTQCPSCGSERVSAYMRHGRLCYSLKYFPMGRTKYFSLEKVITRTLQLRMFASVLQVWQDDGLLHMRTIGHAHPGVWQPCLCVSSVLWIGHQHRQENCQKTGHVKN